MNELFSYADNSIVIKTIVAIWAKKIITDEQYEGISSDELSKYFEIKRAGEFIREKSPIGKSLTSYQKRKLNMYIANMIIDKKNKILELKNGLSNY